MGELKQPKTEQNYYRDIGILAFPTPHSELSGPGFRIANWKEKSGAYLKPKDKIPAVANPPPPHPNDAIDPDRIVNLTGLKTWQVAEVWLNGKNLGVVWKAPYRVDVTSALKPGVNQLRIRVVNLWVNRLIGDAALPAEEPFAKMGPRGAGIQKIPEWLQPLDKWARCSVASPVRALFSVSQALIQNPSDASFISSRRVSYRTSP